MYKTGGLETTPDKPSDILRVDDVDYIVSDKFKTLLRDSFVDWGTFLDIYKKNISDSIMFEQVIKLLDVKETENLRDVMIPLVKKIYNLPAESHMSCMLKQFMLYEPVSIALHAVFTTIKLHYEYLIETFIKARNTYITTNKTKDKLNDLDTLMKFWADLNNQYDLDTSSLLLLFINPPKGLKNELHYKLKGTHEKTMESLKSAMKKFRYPGFCPKVPQERLAKLLEFPVIEITKAIKALDPDAKFPNYEFLEKTIRDKLSNVVAKPVVKDTYERKTPPKDLGKIDLVRWYVDEILSLRKSLLPYGKAYEEYYSNHAKILTEINDIIKAEFNNQ